MTKSQQKRIYRAALALRRIQDSNMVRAIPLKSASDQAELLERVLKSRIQFRIPAWLRKWY